MNPSHFRFALALVILSFVLVLTSCKQQPMGAPVLYVVPTNYRGSFSITLDPKNGVTVPISNGEFVVSIPANGKLLVTSLDFIHGKHVMRSQYANGETMSPGHADSTVTVRLVRPDWSDRNTWLYVVGTRDEQEQLMKRH